LTALLVQICEDEEQQDGNEPGDDRRCDDNTIHRVGVYQLARVAGSLSGENLWIYGFTTVHPNSTEFKYSVRLRFL
jgi:hypothetical protein